jgi:hypothetical protein
VALRGQLVIGLVAEGQQVAQLMYTERRER